MQIQTSHPPLWFCTHAKYYVKSGLTNVLKMPTKPKICIFFRFGLPTISVLICLHPQRGSLSAQCVVLCTKIDIGVAPNTQLHTCVTKIVTFKGGHLMW